MSTLSIGLLNQLGDAFEAAGYSTADITRLRSSIPRLRRIKGVLTGCAEVVLFKHTVDLSVKPFVPNGWTVEEHTGCVHLEWDPDRVALYLSRNQGGGRVVKGNELRVELWGKHPYNASLLDYLLVHPELIPEKWKDRYVFFWGTIYRDSKGDFAVYCLRWHRNEWTREHFWLNGTFDGTDHAAIRVGA